MTLTNVSIQGFTNQNDICDTSKLSQLRGAPQTPGMNRVSPYFPGMTGGVGVAV